MAGYEGHLWSYGIQSEKTVHDLKRFMQGNEDYKKIAEDLHIRYVFWGNREEKEYPGSLLPDELANQMIADGTWGRIYDLLREPK